jgi:hypothetical protein
MADIALTTAGRIEVMDVDVDSSLPLTAGVDIEAGQFIQPDTSGRWALADGNGTGTYANVYMAGKKASAGQGLTGIKKATVDGFAISGVAINSPLYLSNTAGAAADAAGTNVLILGRVIPGPAFPKGGTVDKLFQLDITIAGGVAAA